MASWFLHPEAPVKVSPLATARNYYGRASSHPQEDVEYANARAEALADAVHAKEVASWYLHPSVPVKVSPLASARSYFDPMDQESFEDAEMRASALLEVAHAKEVASWFLHPEAPVKVSPLATARDFFGRASAHPQESLEESNARGSAIADARLQAEVAGWYLHPGKPVFVSPLACARAYTFKGSARATAKRTRGESAVDIFEMEGELSASLVNVAGVSLKPIDYEEKVEDGVAEKEGGNLSRSPSR